MRKREGGREGEAHNTHTHTYTHTSPPKDSLANDKSVVAEGTIGGGATRFQSRILRHGCTYVPMFECIRTHIKKHAHTQR